MLCLLYLRKVKVLMDLKLASDEAGGLEAEVVEEQEGRSLSEGTKLYK